MTVNLNREYTTPESLESFRRDPKMLTLTVTRHETDNGVTVELIDHQGNTLAADLTYEQASQLEYALHYRWHPTTKIPVTMTR